jgi:hypothetical protein
VRRCTGEIPAGSSQPGGAIVIGEGQDVRLIDNVISENRPPILGNQFLRWFAVYFEDVEGTEVSGNIVAQNAVGVETVGFVGAIALQRVRGVIRFQDNVVRDNGGPALFIGEDGQPQDQSALVQNNHFSQGLSNPLGNPLGVLVWVLGIESLLFQGNQCTSAPPTSQIPLLPILLAGTRLNVTGNVVDLSGGSVMGIVGPDLLVSANSVRTRLLSIYGIAMPPVPPGPARVIVTSNLTTGIILASSTGVLIRANNLPPP